MKPSQETAFSFSIAPGFPAVWGPFAVFWDVFFKRELFVAFFFQEAFFSRFFFHRKCGARGFYVEKLCFFFSE